MEVKYSLASACAMVSPEQKECIEYSPPSPVVMAYAIKAAIICGAERVLAPLTRELPDYTEHTVGNTYLLVLSHPVAAPVVKKCSTARTGQVA